MSGGAGNRTLFPGLKDQSSSLKSHPYNKLLSLRQLVILQARYLSLQLFESLLMIKKNICRLVKDV